MNVSLKWKLVALSAVPFFAFLAFAGISIDNNLGQLRILESQTKSLVFMEKEITLINHLQQERGRTSIFMRSGSGKEDALAMRGQVDADIPPFLASLKASNIPVKYLEPLIDLAQRTAEIRGRVDEGGADPGDIFAAYTVLLKSMMECGNGAANLPTAGGIGKRISSMNSLVAATEYLGIYRGLASGVLSSPDAIPFERLMMLLHNHQGSILSLESPSILISDPNKEAFSNLLTMPEWKALEMVMRDLTDSYDSGDWKSAHQEFWNAASSIINAIKTLAMAELSSIQDMNADIENGITRGLLAVLVIFMLMTTLVGILCVFLIRRILIPVRQVARVLETMSSGAGDLTVEVHVRGTDEIAGLGSSFNHFVGGLSGLVSTMRTEVTALGQLGDKLISHVDNSARSGGDILRATGDLEAMAAEQARLAESSRYTIKGLLETIDNLSIQINDQSAGVIQSSASIEEMIANVNTVTGNVDTANRSIAALVDASRNGKVSVVQVGSEVSNAATLSKTLGEINKAIGAIAAQTNLLAMNAAIEAAHAGDAGRGFAVVADEIRNLASTASGQTRQITIALKAMQDAMSKTVLAADRSNAAFALIDELVQQVVGMTGEIKQAMSEQTVGSAEILKAIAAMTEGTEKVRSQSVEMAESSRSVMQAMDQLLAGSSDTARLAARVKDNMQQIDQELRYGKETGNDTRTHLDQVARSMGAFRLRD